MLLGYFKNRIDLIIYKRVIVGDTGFEPGPVMTKLPQDTITNSNKNNKSFFAIWHYLSYFRQNLSQKRPTNGHHVTPSNPAPITIWDKIESCEIGGKNGKNTCQHSALKQGN
jgi:hypothetical protein